jgi:hopene-associated glycosyltransferase HpnB
VFFFFMLYPPAWIRSARRRTAGAAGGCLLVRHAALERVGGVAAIRSELIDDCALAAALKRSGGTLWLGLSRATRSLRRYLSFADFGRTISRTAFSQLGYSALGLLGTAAGLTMVFLLPPGLALAAPTAAGRLLGCAGSLMLCAAYYPALRYYRLSVYWAPLLPLVALFYLGATLDSAVRHWRGQGGTWKGRAQAQR